MNTTKTETFKFQLIKKLQEKAGEEPMAVIKEGTISYLVLNDKANNFDPERLKLMHKMLDKVEADKECKLMITISTTEKFYSTGFNLAFFTKVKEGAVQLTVAMLKLFARILTFPIPTMAVTQGHAFAGGMLLALVHDKRICLKDNARWCMNEMQIGISIYEGYAAMLKELLPPHVARDCMWGGKYSVQDLQKEKVISEIYETDEQLEKLIAQYAQFFSATAHFREVIHDTKKSLHKDLYKALMAGRVSPITYTYISGIRL